ncbi:MAG: caspase family protein [Lentisphaeria bacterium]|jgi:hypothetical protein|nr:caspase family protein [Lentisphaeria bacterium]
MAATRVVLAALFISVRCMGAEEAPRRAMYHGSHALLVGVSDYTGGWADLPSVESELDSVETALVQQGFTVQRVRNPDAQSLHAAYRDFIGTHGYEPDNRLLFYFAGHGYSRRQGKIGYIVPADAPLPTEDAQPFLRHALAMNQLLAWARTMEAKHVLFVFDSCFSGTIFKSRALPEALDAQLMDHPTRQFLTAGDAGEEVPAKSVFTPVFVRGIQGQGDLNGDGVVTGSELGSFVRDRVMGYATGQTPQFGRLQEAEFAAGDFMFRPSGTLPEVVPAAAGERPETGAERGVARRLQELGFETDRVDALRRELARLRVERQGDGSPHSVATVYLLKAGEMSLAGGQYGVVENLLAQVTKLEPGNQEAAELHARLRSLVLASQVAGLEREVGLKAAAWGEREVPKRLQPLRRHLLELAEREGPPEERKRQLEDFGVLERVLHRQMEGNDDERLYAELRFAESLESRHHYRWPFTLLLCNPTPEPLSVPGNAIRGLQIQFVPQAQPEVAFTPPTPFQGMSPNRPPEELAPFAVQAIPGVIQTSGLTRTPYLGRPDGQPITLPDGRHRVLATLEAGKRKPAARRNAWHGQLVLPPVEVVAGEWGELPDPPADQRVRAALSFGKMAIRFGGTVHLQITLGNMYGEPFATNLAEAMRTMTIHFEPIDAPALRPFQLPSPFRLSPRGEPRPFATGGSWSTATPLPPNLPTSYLGRRYRAHLELTFPAGPDLWSGTVRSPEVEVTILPRE